MRKQVLSRKQVTRAYERVKDNGLEHSRINLSVPVLKKEKKDEKANRVVNNITSSCITIKLYTANESFNIR